MSDPIRFYSVGSEFGEFSNFASYPVRLDGRTWPTSEHYFQAMKFTSRATQERIRKTKSPMSAARMGRDRKLPLRRGWNSMRIRVMRKVVLAKFTQHDDLTVMLLETGDADIVEHTSNDAFWGDGGNGSGKNWLGRILMEVREELLQRAADPRVQLTD